MEEDQGPPNLKRSAGGQAETTSAKRPRLAANADGIPPKLLPWSTCLLEIALLACRKRQAVDNEDFDLAHAVKIHESAAAARLATITQAFHSNEPASSASSSTAK